MALIDDLRGAVGAAHVSDDPADRALASSDLFIWPAQQVAELVVKPATTEEAAAAVKLLAAAGKAIVPRGAGLSYTGGVVPTEPGVVLDLTRLDHIEINAEDLYAVVGAGCTWAALADALKPHGLRIVQVNPISGSHSTVGGIAAQNVSGGMDGIIGLTVVLADGTVARTGAGARADGSRFWRNHGPDLTGLFLGDCGAFGIKTEVVLRLVPEKPAFFLSFGFESADPLLASAHDLMRDGVVVRAFAMDKLKSADATKLDAGEAVRTLGAVVKQASGIGEAIRNTAQLVRAGLSSEAPRPWELHLTVEAANDAAAAPLLAQARSICTGHGGQEIDNVIPKTLRAKPYSIRGFVGLAGERWVPVHGLFPLSKARPGMAAMESYFASQASAMAAAGVTVSWLVSSTGPYITIEPMFYWRDALDPIHMHYLSERNRTRFAGGTPNPAARDLVRKMRGDVRDIMDAHQAVHGQVGRFYKLGETMDPGSRALLGRVKAMLDPDRHLNPGSLAL